MPGAAGRARTSCLCLHGRPFPKAATLDLLEERKGLREVRTAAREEAIADQDQREAEHRHADDRGILLETENQDLGAMERKFSEWEKNHAQHANYDWGAASSTWAEPWIGSKPRIKKTILRGGGNWNRWAPTCA